MTHGATQALAPGHYADLAVQTQGTLELTTGTYHFRDITLDPSARIMARGACEVRVAGRFSAGNNLTLAPAPGSQLDAAGLQCFIGGMNGATGALQARPIAVKIGNDAVVQARLIAPNGTLELGNNARVQGVLIGKWLDIGQNSGITKQ